MRLALITVTLISSTCIGQRFDKDYLLSVGGAFGMYDHRTPQGHGVVNSSYKLNTTSLEFTILFSDTTFWQFETGVNINYSEGYLYWRDGGIGGSYGYDGDINITTVLIPFYAGIEVGNKFRFALMPGIGIGLNPFRRREGIEWRYSISSQPYTPPNSYTDTINDNGGDDVRLGCLHIGTKFRVSYHTSGDNIYFIDTYTSINHHFGVYSKYYGIRFGFNF